MDAAAIEAEVDEMRQDLRDLSNDKDAFLAEYRTNAGELNTTIDALEAELTAALAVEQMSDAERQAIGVQLAKIGGD